MSPLVTVLATAGLIVLSAFFVVIEFSLLGARRQRLEEDAGRSASARAALRGMNELTVMLAAAQLGITACTFALGAVTKPAVEVAMRPPLDLLGLPGWLAGGTAFVLSLLVVTFLHLVVGEMAPKSWAISHPEVSARAVALPSRVFVWVFRPMLLWINAIANRLVARTGVEPVDQAAVGGQDAATIRHLVEHSAQVGVLESDYQARIAEAIQLESLAMSALVRKDKPLTALGHDATVAQVQEAARTSGHHRILLRDPGSDELGVIHVRDTLLEPAERPARELSRVPLVIGANIEVHDALEKMRSTSTQFSVVVASGELVGVVTMSDVLRRLLSPTQTAVRPAG